MAALKRLPFKNMLLELSTKENMVERRQKSFFYIVSEPQASVNVSVIELTQLASVNVGVIELTTARRGACQGG